MTRRIIGTVLPDVMEGILSTFGLWRKKKELDPSFVATITELAEMLF